MPTDPRLITSGREIPSLAYCDQPYVVRCDDGAWLCLLCTGPGREGQAGQTVVATRSTDRGASWSAPIPLEPADGPEASYAVPLKAPSGRVFAFYNHNTDDVRRVRADDPPFAGGWCERVDSLGHFAFRWSDDHGVTWSERRVDIPQRRMAIDRENADGGELLYFWNVGKAFAQAGTAYVPLHKVGGFGAGFFTRSEGVLLASADLLTADDPATATWETLPSGDAGLRAPPGGGPVAEEHSFAVLSDGSFFSVYRTIDGHPACAYSRDRGRTWTTPDWLRFADGRPVKHPRAANFLWRCANGNYLYWFHHHGGKAIAERPDRASYAYAERNPVWLAGAVEADGSDGKVLRLSEPVIALYADDPHLRMSYPDLVEEDGRLFLTETQKEIARVHELPPELVDGLWAQLEGGGAGPDAGPVAELTGPGEAPAPELPVFCHRARGGAAITVHERTGVTIDLILVGVDEPGRMLVEHRNARGEGFVVRCLGDGRIELVLRDDWTANAWDTDPGLLRPGRRHRVTFIIDAGPHLVVPVVDGRVQDGGEHRQFGWGRFNPYLRRLGVDAPLRAGTGVERLRIFARALSTSEAIALQRATQAGRRPEPRGSIVGRRPA